MPNDPPRSPAGATTTEPKALRDLRKDVAYCEKRGFVSSEFEIADLREVLDHIARLRASSSERGGAPSGMADAALAIADEWFATCDCITTETGGDALRRRYREIRQRMHLAPLPACKKCGGPTTQYHDAAGDAIPATGVCERCRVMTAPCGLTDHHADGIEYVVMVLDKIGPRTGGANLRGRALEAARIIRENCRKPTREQIEGVRAEWTAAARAGHEWPCKEVGGAENCEGAECAASPVERSDAPGEEAAKWLRWLADHVENDELPPQRNSVTAESLRNIAARLSASRSPAADEGRGADTPSTEG